MSSDIDVYINDGVDNIEDKIWAEKTSDGRRLVVINSPDGFSKFGEKKRIV